MNFGQSSSPDPCPIPTHPWVGHPFCSSHKLLWGFLVAPPNVSPWYCPNFTYIWKCRVASFLRTDEVVFIHLFPSLFRSARGMRIAFTSPTHPKNWFPGYWTGASELHAAEGLRPLQAVPRGLPPPRLHHREDRANQLLRRFTHIEWMGDVPHASSASGSKTERILGSLSHRSLPLTALCLSPLSASRISSPRLFWLGWATERLKSIINKTLMYNPMRRAQEFLGRFQKGLPGS